MQTPHRPEVTKIRPTLSGIDLHLRCANCRYEFPSDQHTIGGVPVGEHVCPACFATHALSPEDFFAALQRLLWPQSLHEQLQLTEEAKRLTETWYRGTAIAQSLTYRGINLGEPIERELLFQVVSALRKSKQHPRTES